MKTLDETIQEVKDLIKDWDWKEEDDIEHILESIPVLTLVEETAHRFAKSVAQQALENASEKAGLIWNLTVGPFGGEAMVPEIDKSSITSPDNVPTI